MTALPAVRVTDLTNAQITLVKRTVAKDTNDTEFDHFIAVARQLRLDPLRRQICAMVFSKGDAEKRNMAIIVQIDGQRAIANRCGDYGPMRTAPKIEYSEEAKGPANPLGIVSCEVTLWKKSETEWFPVVGVAHWSEYAPVTKSADEYDYVDTGEVWADTGKPKKKKVPKGDVTERLDPKSPWARMPHVMIAKVAESQALRRGWPEQLSGVYSDEEMEKAIHVDVLASEIIAQEEEARRETKIGHGQGLMFQVAEGSPLVHVGRGQIADWLHAVYRNATTAKEIATFRTINAESLKAFWAWEPGDAHEAKVFAEQRTAILTEDEKAKK